MRLIDADKLIYQSHAQHLEPYINKRDIDNAPTVEMAEDCVKRNDVLDLLQMKYSGKELYKAIYELSSVTPQPCEDCISREQAQNIMAILLSDYLHDEDREKIENANAEIGELPSVQPQPKRGKWIEHEDGGYDCSNCCEHFSYNHYHYCPCCGSQNREVDG